MLLYTLVLQFILKMGKRKEEDDTLLWKKNKREQRVLP